MRGMYFFKVAILALVLGLTLTRAEAENRGIIYYQLLYLFDPDSSEQLRRALDLERATLEVKGVELLGIVDSGDTGSPWLNRLDFKIMSVDDFLQQDQAAPGAVKDWFGSGDRDLLLVKHTDGSTTSVAEEDFEATIQRLSTTSSISTEVDVTTWGKVKDLFN